MRHLRQSSGEAQKIQPQNGGSPFLTLLLTQAGPTEPRSSHLHSYFCALSRLTNTRTGQSMLCMVLTGEGLSTVGQSGNWSSYWQGSSNKPKDWCITLMRETEALGGDTISLRPCY